MARAETVLFPNTAVMCGFSKDLCARSNSAYWQGGRQPVRFWNCGAPEVKRRRWRENMEPNWA